MDKKIYILFFMFIMVSIFPLVMPDRIGDEVGDSMEDNQTKYVVKHNQKSDLAAEIIFNHKNQKYIEPNITELRRYGYIDYSELNDTEQKFFDKIERDINTEIEGKVITEEKPPKRFDDVNICKDCRIRLYDQDDNGSGVYSGRTSVFGFYSISFEKTN